MKKSLIILAFFTITMSSCYTYSCPTYAKKTPKMIELEKQLQENMVSMEKSKDCI
jgi:hypothetical protein